MLIGEPVSMGDFKETLCRTCAVFVLTLIDIV